MRSFAFSTRAVHALHQVRKQGFSSSPALSLRFGVDERRNTIAGHIKWTGYRSGPRPTIRIEHHKTGAIIAHRLEADGVKFYADAEGVLAKLPRRGIPMVLREPKNGNAKRSAPCNIGQRVRKATGEVDYVEALAH
jgi:hypothetical protein